MAARVTKVDRTEATRPGMQMFQSNTLLPQPGEPCIETGPIGLQGKMDLAARKVPGQFLLVPAVFRIEAQQYRVASTEEGMATIPK